MKPVRMASRWWSPALAAVAALILPGCSVISEPAPPPPQYRLVPAPEAFQSRPDGPVLLVSGARAESGFTTTAMRYTRSGPELLGYADGEWVSPPQGMVIEAAMRALGGSGRYRAVIAESDAVRADLRLTLQLGELLHDQSSGEVRLGVRAVLVDQAGRVRFADVFVTAVPADGDGAGAMAVAARRALDVVLARLVERVSQAVSTTSGRAGN